MIEKALDELERQGFKIFDKCDVCGADSCTYHGKVLPSVTCDKCGDETLARAVKVTDEGGRFLAFIWSEESYHYNNGKVLTFKVDGEAFTAKWLSWDEYCKFWDEILSALKAHKNNGDTSSSL